jgi:hypothetical protein
MLRQLHVLAAVIPSDKAGVFELLEDGRAGLAIDIEQAPRLLGSEAEGWQLIELAHGAHHELEARSYSMLDQPFRESDSHDALLVSE